MKMRLFTLSATFTMMLNLAFSNVSLADTLQVCIGIDGAMRVTSACAVGETSYNVISSKSTNCLSFKPRAILVGCDLRNVAVGKNLTGADLTGANLSGKNLSGVSFLGAKLKEANLSNTNLQNTNFIWAELNGANLTKASLSGAQGTANFDSANIFGANLSGITSFAGVNLSYTRLVGSLVNTTVLNQATMNALTICPTGLPANPTC